MRISETLLGRISLLLLLAFAAGGTAALAPASALAASQIKYRSTEDAINQGLSAYNGGFYEQAVPALEFAAKKGTDIESFLARYYLARIFADSNGAYTDHPRAYEIFQQLADEHADMDGDADPRARFVAKALVALARYIRLGLPQLGLEPDAVRAAEYLQHAATMFGDEDAQFELAKLLLKGDGVERNVPQAKHWLSTLSQAGHPSAQAFLADLYWRGKIVEPDHVKALALITIAVANAPQHERVWIEDIYQNIYCGAADGVRTQATGLVADWRTRYGRRARPDSRDRLGVLSEGPLRTCKDGQRVAPYGYGRYEPAGGGANGAESVVPPRPGSYERTEPRERQAVTAGAVLSPPPLAGGSALGAGPLAGPLAGPNVGEPLDASTLGGSAFGFHEAGAVLPPSPSR